jgi:LacI family transcriptional regulator
MPPTLRQIAERAGVDTSTASRVLTGKAREFRIAAGTAQRVEKVAQELGFRPNLTARALRTQRSRVLGLLVADLANPFFATIAGAVEAEIAPHGYSLMVASSGESAERQATYLEVFRARQIDGIIVAPAPAKGPDRGLAEAADERHLVLVDRLASGLTAPAVVVDNAGGMGALVRALARAGRRRLALVAGATEAWTMKERARAFRREAEREKVWGGAALERITGFDVAAGREAARALLDARNPPDAIVAANNLLLQGALEAAVAAGVPPTALGFAAFDGLPLLELSPYPVVVAEQPAAELGRLAALRLLERLEGTRTPAETLALPLAVRTIGRDHLSS